MSYFYTFNMGYALAAFTDASRSHGEDKYVHMLSRGIWLLSWAAIWLSCVYFLSMRKAALILFYTPWSALPASLLSYDITLICPLVALSSVCAELWTAFRISTYFSFPHYFSFIQDFQREANLHDPSRLSFSDWILKAQTLLEFHGVALCLGLIMLFNPILSSFVSPVATASFLVAQGLALHPSLFILKELGRTFFTSMGIITEKLMQIAWSDEDLQNLLPRALPQEALFLDVTKTAGTGLGAARYAIMPTVVPTMRATR